jgi:zinc protease
MKKLCIQVASLVTLWVVTAVNAQAAVKIDTWTLDNGARVYLVESHALPIVDLSVQFDAGSRRDPADKAGLAQMTNILLTRGVLANGTAPALTESQVLDGFADIVADYGGGAATDMGGVSLRVLAEPADRDAAVQLLGRVLAAPSFPEEALARDKARMIAGLKDAQTQPGVIAGETFQRAMYRAHPYAYEASPESVAKISRDDVVNFHRTHYVASQAVVTIVGDVSKTLANEIALTLTSQLPKGTAQPAMPPVPAQVASDQRIAHPASQSHILIGMAALERGDPDFFPLHVGNYVLGGGGFVSRLMQQVREKRGLTYGVSSGFSPLAQPGPFTISLQTQKAHTEEALQVTLQTLEGFLKSGPTAEELKAAKDNLIGGYALNLDSNRKLLALTAMIAYYRLPLDYIDTWTDKVQQVTAEQVRAAFTRKVQADKLSIVVVGQGK